MQRAVAVERQRLAELHPEVLDELHPAALAVRSVGRGAPKVSKVERPLAAPLAIRVPYRIDVELQIFAPKSRCSLAPATQP